MAEQGPQAPATTGRICVPVSNFLTSLCRKNFYFSKATETEGDPWCLPSPKQLSAGIGLQIRTILKSLMTDLTDTTAKLCCGPAILDTPTSLCPGHCRLRAS